MFAFIPPSVLKDCQECSIEKENHCLLSKAIHSEKKLNDYVNTLPINIFYHLGMSFAY
ncbi:hypothetical protein LEP1GSC017_1117 [Leptospira meyeri serovar Hardjo str. Went 5]|nr:hypothetical protein LEP1GSC017_1117 [Leptospira meyeri serovar Hardjo str. Went 5]